MSKVTVSNIFWGNEVHDFPLMSLTVQRRYRPRMAAAGLWAGGVEVVESELEPLFEA